MKFKKWLAPLTILIATIGLFCITLPILAWRGEVSAPVLLELGRVLLSWPVAILVIVLLFVSRFHTAIDAYLRNIRFMKLPAGIEIQSQPAAGEVENEGAEPGTLHLTAEQQEALGNFVGGLFQQQQQVAQAQAAELRTQLVEALRNSYLWKFLYLNSFYVLNTKLALLSLYMNPQQTRAQFHETFGYQVADVHQRETILAVLNQYGMITEQNGLLQVTQEGQLFLQYIGMAGAPEA